MQTEMVDRSNSIGFNSLETTVEVKPSDFNEDAMTVNSGEVQYNGKEIILVGQVIVQHALGLISAHHLSVLPSIKDKKNKFGFLKINEDVEIQFKQGGKLYCQQAEVDYANMQGTFSGNAAQPDVTYLNRGEQKEANQKERAPLEFKSIQMTLELIRETSSLSSPAPSSARTRIKQIEADRNVRVHYNQDYLLLADHARYQCIPDETSALAGFLTLSVKDNLPACTLTNLNGDNLSAQVIKLNTIERILWLEHPVGTFYIRRKSQPTQTLEILAKELVWEDEKQNLQLKREVNVTQNQSLNIHTSHEISITQAMIEGEKTIKSLYSPQDTQVSYTDFQKKQVHKVNCPGPFNIDHERQEMLLQGLLNSVGQRDEEQQVFLDDVQGEMYADQVLIQYTWINRQFVPEKIILEGNVRLMNRFNGHEEESGGVLHHVLADRVDYFPKKREMLLTGFDGRRVLFFDKSNNVQMSAPSLKVQNDPITQKAAVQGFGDVRFTFIEKELEQLKNHFPFQKELQSGKSNKK